ncbi:hypothetical protein [uncultured Ilyobacter sp.]|uniref:hypothetical protein n=1 Tax=uncultured Ilyobacter sp. TaxID=544433 RepID=UPI0029C02B39|nr:hypothetical protein [uncultured Ilyobacter sp.]
MATWLDSFLFLDTYYRLKFPMEKFWYFHIGLSLIFILLNHIFFHKDIYYFDLLIFLFPVMGFGGLLFIELIPKLDTDYQMIEESSDFKTYLKNRREIEFIDLAVELGTMGAFDILATGTPEEKKRFLINFNPPDERFKVEVLEKALLDEDIDVIHYAATELNWIYEKHGINIQKANQSGDLDKIFKSYNDYIESGLLKGDVLLIAQKKALHSLKTLFDRDKTYAVKLLEFYKNMDDNKCQINLERLLEEEEPDAEVLNFALEYYYEKNWYEKIIQMKERFVKKGIEMPYHLRKHIKGA